MHHSFHTVSKGLDMNSYPMKLWAKAKKYGTWDPQDLDFAQDKKDWDALPLLEKTFLTRIICQFQGGEEAVTLDLLPLIMAIAKEGRLEEEMFLTSFLWEEAKHVEGFNRYIDEVIGREFFEEIAKTAFTPSYKLLFYEVLPETMEKLLTDSSPQSQARASVTYNMIIECVLAETGYKGFYDNLEANNILPGMMAFTHKLKQDESRHIAYGIYLLSRLVSDNGDEVWEAIQDQMQKVMTIAINQVTEGDNLYEDDNMPFGMPKGTYTVYAQEQFMKRFARLQKARNQSFEEIQQEAEMHE